MKKITLWVSGVLLAIGMTGSANAMSFNHSYSIEKGRVASAVKAFNKMMRVDVKAKYKNNKHDSVGWILGELKSGNHRMKPGNARSALARVMAKVRKHSAYNLFGAKHMAPVPEPEIYAMLIGGMFVVSRMARRRRKTS